jgi:drug/metabolite transporter (DMT)-like permease
MSSPSAEKIPAVASPILQGMGLMVISTLLAPGIDIFAKLATDSVSPGVITLARFVFQALFMLPLVIVNGSWRRFSIRRSLIHAVRAAVIVIAMVCFVTTLAEMAVADAIAIFFVEPIILTVLASIFLGETIGWRRYTACAVGFLGAVIVIRPSFADVGYVALLPIVTAFCFAIFGLINRTVSQHEDTWSMQFQMALWGVPMAALLLWAGHAAGMAVLEPSWPSGTAMIWLFGVGVVAALSGFLSVSAYRLAPASVLAPLQYIEIVSATVFGWLVFGNFPDAVKWLGIAIIIGSGLYIVFRERQLQRGVVSETKAVPP